MRSYAVPFLRHECMRDPSLTMFARDDHPGRMVTFLCANFFNAAKLLITMTFAAKTFAPSPHLKALLNSGLAGATQTGARPTRKNDLWGTRKNKKQIPRVTLFERQRKPLAEAALGMTAIAK